MSSEALIVLKRSRSQLFRAGDAEALRVVLSRAAALWERSPEPGLDTLIAALEQNIRVLERTAQPEPESAAVEGVPAAPARGQARLDEVRQAFEPGERQIGGRPEAPAAPGVRPSSEDVEPGRPAVDRRRPPGLAVVVAAVVLHVGVCVFLWSALWFQASEDVSETVRVVALAMGTVLWLSAPVFVVRWWRSRGPRRWKVLLAWPTAWLAPFIAMSILVSFGASGSGQGDANRANVVAPVAAKPAPVADIGDYEPAWSPDGSAVVFSSDRSGDAEILVARADGSGPLARGERGSRTTPSSTASRAGPLTAHTSRSTAPEMETSTTRRSTS